MAEMVDYGHKAAAAKTKTKKIFTSSQNGIDYRKAAAMAVLPTKPMLSMKSLPPDFP